MDQLCVAHMVASALTFIAFGLLGQLGQVDGVFVTHRGIRVCREYMLAKSSKNSAQSMTTTGLPGHQGFRVLAEYAVWKIADRHRNLCSVLRIAPIGASVIRPSLLVVAGCCSQTREGQKTKVRWGYAQKPTQMSYRRQLQVSQEAVPGRRFRRGWRLDDTDREVCGQPRDSKLEADPRCRGQMNLGRAWKDLRKKLELSESKFSGKRSGGGRVAGKKRVQSRRRRC
jgi:hypothetical protein